MSTALTNANNSAVGNPFAAAGAGAGQRSFMKFKGAGGDFLFGQDDDEMPHGTQFAADIENSKWNWTFWWDGEVLKTDETTVIEDPHGWKNEPDYLPEDYDGEMSLKEIRAEQADRKSNFMDGWSCQAVLDMRLIGGAGLEDPEMGLEFGEDFTIKLNQGVALTAFRALLSSFGKQFRTKEGLVPVVEIDARSYVSKIKSVGKRYTPVLKIVDWRSEAELMEDVGEDEGMYDDPADGPADEAPALEDKSASADKAAPADEAAPEEDEKPKPRGRGARGARGSRNYE